MDQDIEIKITMPRDGKPIRISGPIKEELLCYGLLVKAAMIIAGVNDPKRNIEAKPGIIQASGPLPNSIH